MSPSTRWYNPIRISQPCAVTNILTWWTRSPSFTRAGAPSEYTLPWKNIHWKNAIVTHVTPRVAPQQFRPAELLLVRSLPNAYSQHLSPWTYLIKTRNAGQKKVPTSAPKMVTTCNNMSLAGRERPDWRWGCDLPSPSPAARWVWIKNGYFLMVYQPFHH